MADLSKVDEGLFFIKKGCYQVEAPLKKNDIINN